MFDLAMILSVTVFVVYKRCIHCCVLVPYFAVPGQSVDVDCVTIELNSQIWSEVPRAAWYFCQNIPCVKFSEAKLDGNLFFLFTNESLQNSLNVGQQQGWMLLIGQYENVKCSQCWLCCGPSFQVLAWSRIEQRELQWSCETWQCVNITCWLLTERHKEPVWRADMMMMWGTMLGAPANNSTPYTTPLISILHLFLSLHHINFYSYCIFYFQFSEKINLKHFL